MNEKDKQKQQHGCTKWLK